MIQFDFLDLKNKLITIIKDALIVIDKTKSLDIKKKELNDIATFADEFIEKKLREFIHSSFPLHRIIGEEDGDNNIDSPYEWIIDPIDGTVNYAAKIPFYSSTIALRYCGETIFGLIYDIPNNDVYYAIKGKGSYKNDIPLKVSDKSDLSESIVTICLTSSYDETLTEEVLSIIKKLQPHLRGIRIIVSTAYELSWIALGLTEGMINIKPSLGVSSKAGILMVTEANGKVSNIKGNKRRNIGTLLVTNGLIHDEIVKIINS